MISHTTEGFWKTYARLPEPVKRQAREAYRLFERDPFHPSPHFKRVARRKPIYSVRVNIHVRAVGVLEGDEILWF